MELKITGAEKGSLKTRAQINPARFMMGPLYGSIKPGKLKSNLLVIYSFLLAFALFTSHVFVGLGISLRFKNQGLCFLKVVQLCHGPRS